ncbi:MAG: SGNH/GDSL hydrolase family protein [Bacteroidia bacterium]|nr:SGNH/GDSL hydrolase family protein [Bacteroidia bacterium]
MIKLNHIAYIGLLGLWSLAHACNSRPQPLVSQEENADAPTPQSLSQDEPLGQKVGNQPSEEPQNNTLMDLASHHTGLDSLITLMKQGEPVKIVCYGNSITHGYRVGSFGQVAHPYPEVLEERLQNQFKNPHIRVINEGHNGWRSDQALASLPSLVLKQLPHLVIVKFGINDAYSQFSGDFTAIR